MQAKRMTAGRWPAVLAALALGACGAETVAERPAEQAPPVQFSSFAGQDVLDASGRVVGIIPWARPVQTAALRGLPPASRPAAVVAAPAAAAPRQAPAAATLSADARGDVIPRAAAGPKPRSLTEQETAALVKPDCYTVDYYQRYLTRRADAGVPAEKRAFLGKWGGGAWDGEVCHDIHVISVSAEGVVDFLDAHGPGWGGDATAFRRKGLIGDDGVLRVRKGPATVEYWIGEDGRLHGRRVLYGLASRVVLTPGRG